MNELPSGWIDTTVGDVCSIYAGYGFPERLQGRSQGDLAFFKVGDISESWKRGEPVLVNANHYISLADAEELRATPLPANTVVFAKIGAAIALNRRALLSVPSLVDNNVMGLHQQKELLNPKYLFHFACTLKLDELSRATTVPSLRKGDVAALRFPLAPLAEQERVVAEIEKQFTRLDAAVAALKRVQGNLKRYRAAVLKAACEGRLVPTEAELARKEGRSYETGARLLARILQERRAKWEADQLAKMHGAGKSPQNDDWRKKYKEPRATNADNLPTLPEGWAWASADQLCSQVTDGEHIQPPYQPEGLPMLSAMHVRDGWVELENFGRISGEAFSAAVKRCKPEKDDVLIVSVGATTGRAAIVQIDEPFAIVRSVLLLKCVRSMSGLFLLNWIRSPWCQEWIRTASGASAQPHFYISDAKRMPVPLPPETEIARICEELDRSLPLLNSAAQSVSANVARADRLHQSILKRAFEGKLVPQDPSDEPASVLLERIRAERPPKAPPSKRTPKTRRTMSAVAEVL